MNLLQRHKAHWANKQYIGSTILGLIFFMVSGLIHYQAGIFASKNISNSVADLLLKILPVVDVNIIFNDGIILFWAVVTALMLWRPQGIAFVLKSLGLFMLVRSLFVILTHLGPHPNQIAVDYNSIISKFTFEGDFFFSGHTGAPFLMSLIFWHDRYFRWIFLVSSIIFGISVLLGRLHYSIDVFGAYFITYGVFHIALKFFKNDYNILVTKQQ